MTFGKERSYSNNEPRSLPKGFRLRAAELSDLEAVTALYTAVQLDLRGESELISDELLSFWRRPGFSLKTDAWVVEAQEEDGDHPLVGYGDIAYKAGYTHLRGDGCVHPLYRNLGIGTALMHRLENRAFQIASLAAPDDTVILRNVLDTADRPGRLLHENEGYLPVRYFFQMEIEMNAAPPDPLLPHAIELRPFQSGQERILFKTIEEGFRDHWGHAQGEFEVFLHDTVEQANFDPGLILAAWDGDEMAGCAICQIRQKRGWVRQLTVRRPWRRQGLGRALLQKAFCEIHQRGNRFASLGVDAASETGATRLYERAGMEIVRRNVVYEEEVRPPE
jgi:mycothiol synthase